MKPIATYQNDAASRSTSVRYVVLAFIVLVVIINYVQRASISAAVGPIRDDLGLDLVDMGWVMTAFGIPYVLCQVPTGWLGYHVGSRLALSAYAAVWSVVTGLTGLAHSYQSLLLFRLGLGAAQSGGFPCSTHSLSLWFPRTEHGRAVAIFGCGMSVGGIVGFSLSSLLLSHVSWRTMFLIYCVPGLVWSALFFYWFRDHPEKHRSVNRTELALIREGTGPGQNDIVGNHRPPVPWTALARNPTIWALTCQHLLRGSGYVFFGTWFFTYLKETRGTTLAETGILTAVPLLADVVGRLTGGGVSDQILLRTGSLRLSRSGVAGASLLFCAACILAAYFIESALPATLVLASGMFFSGTSAACSHATAMDVGGEYAGVVYGIMNSVGSLDTFCPVLVAKLVAETGSWDLVLFCFVGVYVLAAAAWLFLDPNRSVEADGVH
jgi:sugar phosphate permease